MRHFLVAGAAVIVVAGAYGACFQLAAQPERTTPWPAYLVLLFLAGLVGLGGELVAEKISGSDDVADPLPKRVGRLLLLLCAAGVTVVALYSILSRA